MSMERKCQLSENTGNNIELDLVSVEKHHIQKLDFLAQLWHIVGRKTNK